jgi:Ni/Fe-hydrogenase subunit HybB-like protein
VTPDEAKRPALPPDQDPAAVTDQLAGIPLDFPQRRRWLVGLLLAGALLALFVVAVAMVFTHGVGIWGINAPVFWAFAILNYVWWLGIGHAGTLISALLLLLGREWRNSLNRFAEAMTLCAVVCAAIFPIIHLGRPWFFFWMFPYPATMSVWPQFRSPLEWDVWAIGTYLTVSIVFWYIGLIPDLAAVRDRARSRGAQVLFGILCLGWRGAADHWARWRQAYVMTAAIAVPLVVSVHSEVSLLFAVGQLPGWHSTVFPPYFVLGAAFSGFAVVSMIAIVLRHAYRLDNLVTIEHFDVLGMIVLATGLMTGYGYAAELFDALYSGGLEEIRKMHERLAGEFAWSYWGAVVFNFIAIQPLWWRAARRAPIVLFAVSLAVAVGMWCERFMIVVGTLYRDFMPEAWHGYTPSFWEWATFAGTFGLFLVPFFLFVRIFPMISIFEVKESLHREQEVQHG